MLAATHLLTLGFMAHAMLGALLQLLPVALVLSGAQLGVSLTRAALFARSSRALAAAAGRLWSGDVAVNSVTSARRRHRHGS